MSITTEKQPKSQVDTGHQTKPRPVATIPSSEGDPQALGYALWKYEANTWHLTKDCSIQGAVVSGPPTVAGAFEGQIRATPSVAG